MLLPWLTVLSLGWTPTRSPLRAMLPPVASRPCTACRVQLSLEDPRLVSVSLDRVTGIDFGCDLSLRWPFVLALVPEGAASRSGQVHIGDQLIAISGDAVVGLDMASTMKRLGEAEGDEIELLFFRGTREQLQAVVQREDDSPPTVTITLEEDGKQKSFEVPYGANLRDQLVERKINVYQSLTRWTNCNGKQLCGTCIVDVVGGLENCTRRSIDEASTLRENPPTYKLACITNLYGDVTIQLMPKVGAAQWTR